MRIGLIVPEYPPDIIGGGGVVYEALAREYAARGHEVHVFSSWDTIRSWGEGPRHERLDRVGVTRYPLSPIGKRKPYLRSVPPPNLRSCRELQRDLASWRPDVAHLHGYGYAIVDLAAWLLRARGVPFVFTIHGLPVTPLHRSHAVRLAYRSYEHVGPRRVVQMACSVTAVSREVAGRVAELAPVVVIPNGVSPFPRGTRRDVLELRRQLDIPPAVPVVAAAGRLARSKGFDVLIEAFKRLEIPRAACVIAGGDGGELGRLNAMGRSVRAGLFVRLPGVLDRVQLGRLAQAATVVAVPSRDEPFGLVAIEALAAERRLVAAKVGGLAEFLRGPVAELVEGEDPVIWARALSRALEQGPLDPAEREVARTIVRAHSWPRLAGNYESILLDCAERPRDAGDFR